MTNPNRLSNASFLSLSSVRTLLPKYNVIDATEQPSSSTTNPTRSPTSPFFSNRLSSVTTLLPHYSVVDTLREPTTGSRFDPLRSHEFRYSYPIRAKNPWATLHLHTRDAPPGTRSKYSQNQPRVPRFWSRDPVAGAVQLDLDGQQNIQQISITLHGSIVLSSHTGGSLPFLKHEFTVWESTPPQSDNTDSNSTQKKKCDGRLISGQHTFPFSLPFPTHADPILNNVASSNSGNGSTNTRQPQRRWTRRFTSESPSSSSQGSQTSDHPQSEPRHSLSMPPTFMEKDVNPNVAYNISVRIVHGRFKTSSKIKTNIAYFPTSEPLPASQKRREAYEAGALIPCPMNDPDGWFALPTVTIYGVLKTDDDSLHTRVDCTLYMAQPLSYTRGSVIPCFITIQSDGVEVAHLLPSTEMPTVRFLRRVWHPVANYENPSPDLESVGNTSWAYAMVPTSVMDLVTHDVGCANWWMPSKDIVQSPNARHLEGEIHLSPDLQPSCDFPFFRIEYAVELLSLKTANFKPEVLPPSPGKLMRTGDNVIASNTVEIAALYRQDEPVPIAYSELPKTYHMLLVSSDKGAINPASVYLM